MKAVNIKWDIDEDYDDDIDVLQMLPDEIEIPNEVAYYEDGEIDYDGIADYLSDETGFCHDGYVLED